MYIGTPAGHAAQPEVDRFGRIVKLFDVGLLCRKAEHGCGSPSHHVSPVLSPMLRYELLQK
jgi:hypothetical protein